MSYEQDRTAAYRCVIAPENSDAELRVGAKSFHVNLVDCSREGFTVRIPSTVLKRVRNKPNLRLEYRGELWEVRIDGEFIETGDTANLSLTRTRDLTRVRMPSGFQFSFGQMFSLQQDPTFLLALMLAFLAACFCLPESATKSARHRKSAERSKRRGHRSRSLTFPSRSW